MTNPYDIHEPADVPRPATSTGASDGLVRPALWVLLVVSAAANMVTSSAGLNPLVGVDFGLLTLACITALVVHHYTHRSR